MDFLDENKDHWFWL